MKKPYKKPMCIRFGVDRFGTPHPIGASAQLLDGIAELTEARASIAALKDPPDPNWIRKYWAGTGHAPPWKKP